VRWRSSTPGMSATHPVLSPGRRASDVRHGPREPIRRWLRPMVQREQGGPPHGVLGRRKHRSGTFACCGHAGSFALA
jgi:hypothetical protein